MPKVIIGKATAKNKKLKAVFYDTKGKKVKTVQFGQLGADDYTKTRDKEQRSRYIERHRQRENWDSYMTAGSLSRWILWGDSTSLKTNISKYKRKFNLK
jgi:hypothetical protein